MCALEIEGTVRSAKIGHLREEAGRLMNLADSHETNRPKADAALAELLAQARKTEEGTLGQAEIAWRFLLHSTHPQVESVVEEALEHPNMVVRRLALEWFFRNRNPRAEEFLEKAAKQDIQVKVRGAAAKWLSQLQSDRNQLV